jgi:hypothetical protein
MLLGDGFAGSGRLVISSGFRFRPDNGVATPFYPNTSSGAAEPCWQLSLRRLFPFPRRSVIAFLGAGHGTIERLVCPSKPKSQSRIRG